MGQYYVYGIFINSIIIYIGKGSGNRKDHHLRNFLLHNTAVNRILKSKLHNAIENNDTIEIAVIKNNLSEDEALLEESFLIKKHGRKISGTGPLCNITEGGNQPPSIKDLYKILDKEEYIKIQEKRTKTQKLNYIKKIEKIAPIIKQKINDGMMLRNIAKELKISVTTLNTYIRKAGIEVSYKGKQEKIKQHLEKYRLINKQTPSRNAKLYTVKEPSGNITQTRQLKQYCNRYNLDYSNLRATFKRGGSCKGYSIIDQQEPETLQ